MYEGATLLHLKNMNIVLFTLLIIALLSPMVAQAQEVDFKAVTLDASDVNCKKCHVISPHVIHDDKPVECVDCHGRSLSVKIPQCSSCHSGPIHEVHISKVNENSCASCHNNIEGKHQTFLADSVCEHCHKNLFDIHGNDDSCVKCHQNAPSVVKPYVSPEMTLVCENCHEADNVAYVHGNESDLSGCYRCHRAAGTDEVDTQVPHRIHVPKVECTRCHVNTNTKADALIVVPECTKCHNIQNIHSFDNLGKGMQSDVNCGVCHLDMATEQEGTTTGSTDVEEESHTIKETTSPVVETAPPIEIEERDAESPEEESAAETPGFGALAGILAASLVFILRRVR